MSESAGRVCGYKWELDGTTWKAIPLVPEQLLVEVENENIASEAIIWRKVEELDAKLAAVRALADELTSVLADADPCHPVISGAHSIANRLRTLTETPSEETR